MARQMQKKQGFLARLARNQAGNVIAMYAAAILPLIGMLGGGIDMGRIYLTRARLQQACDAGALAGRKQMAGGAWSANSGRANTVATNMFNANFQSGAYGTSGLTKSFSESGGTVTGTTSVVVPMTLMKVFGQQSRTISVTCDAEMRIPNTDVMFVLDVTGSMGETNTGDTSAKIVGLRQAVRCFYETLAKIDTVANCGSTPSGGTTNVQLRFGFVPYSSNVNVGRLLKNEWMADNWTYQSREAVWGTESYVVSYTSSVSGPSRTTETYWESISNSDCTSYGNNQSFGGWGGFSGGTNPVNSGSEPSPGGTSSATVTVTSDQYSKRDWGATSDTSGSYRTCRRYRDRTTTTYTPVMGTRPVFSHWIYKPVSFNVSGLKAGDSNWNNSVTLPVGASGTNVSVPWNGCIEERQTVSQSSYSPIPGGAFDLDIDTLPSNSATQWGPSLPDAVWGRYDAYGNNTTSNVSSASNLSHNISSYCPAAARRLQIYTSATDYDNYVATLTPTGNTYHDIGLIWGARLLSPTGLFASDNATTPNGGEIQRHMIFMTDGDACTGTENYTAYGAQWWDRRTTGSASAPTDGCTTTGTLTQQVNARTDALCTAIRNKNITLWVVSFGSGVSGTIQTRLQNCATPGRFFSAANTSQLLANFQTIANQISALRLTN